MYTNTASFTPGILTAQVKMPANFLARTEGLIGVEVITPAGSTLPALLQFESAYCVVENAKEHAKSMYELLRLKSTEEYLPSGAISRMFCFILTYQSKHIFCSWSSGVDATYVEFTLETTFKAYIEELSKAEVKVYAPLKKGPLQKAIPTALLVLFVILSVLSLLWV